MNATRSHRYHRRRDRQPYLRALAAMLACRWTDERIAAALSLLSPETIENLESQGWEEEAIEDAIGIGEQNCQPWTTRQVRYYRRRHLDRKRRRPPIAVLVEARRTRSRQAQTRAGFGNLLPDYIQPTADTESHWSEGIELPPRASQILKLLRERPMTSREIAQAIRVRNHRSLHNSSGYLLVCLMRLGLLVRDCCRRYCLKLA